MFYLDYWVLESNISFITRVLWAQMETSSDKELKREVLSESVECFYKVPSV